MTAQWIHVRTWDYGKLMGFELKLPVDQLHRYYKTNEFPSLGAGGRMLGGLHVLRYADPETGKPEDLALLLSQEPAAMQALQTATGKPLEEA